MLTYNQVISLPLGTKVSYKEYVLDRHEKRSLSYSIENFFIERIIPEEFKLNIDDLVLYLGDAPDEDYLAHSYSTVRRIVLSRDSVTSQQAPKKEYVIIELVPYFFEIGLQVLDIDRTPITTLHTQDSFYGNILGFKDYDYGWRYKHE